MLCHVIVESSFSGVPVCTFDSDYLIIRPAQRAQPDRHMCTLFDRSYTCFGLRLQFQGHYSECCYEVFKFYTSTNT